MLRGWMMPDVTVVMLRGHCSYRSCLWGLHRGGEDQKLSDAQCDSSEAREVAVLACSCLWGIWTQR